MVKLDIDMPESCDECPCSHMLLYGKEAGQMICCAIEYRGIMREGVRPSNCILKNNWLHSRSEDCPMKSEGM